MNDQERQIIDDMFGRLEQVANQPRDPETERYIAEKVRRQPYAPYAMAQAVFVQEQALTNLNAEIEQLRAELDRMQRQPQGGGLLSSIFGGGSRQPEPMRPQGGSPWGRPAQQPMQGRYGQGKPQQSMGGGFGGGGPWGNRGGGGGGFLQTAMGTAAGVAGGMMIANALSNAFGGNDAAGSAGESASGLAGLSDGQGSDAGSNGGITDSLYQNAGAEQNDPSADFGGDGGDSGDWT